MAKKDPTEMSVEDKLKTLFQLQTTLSAIDEKRALRGELPLEVQDLEDEIEGLKIRVDKLKTEVDEFNSAISQLLHSPKYIYIHCTTNIFFVHIHYQKLNVET